MNYITYVYMHVLVLKVHAYIFKHCIWWGRGVLIIVPARFVHSALYTVCVVSTREVQDGTREL